MTADQPDAGRRRRSSRRAAGGAQVTTIWWRDIPTQVMGRSTDGSDVVRTELPRRFLVAVDRAAMELDLAGTDEYLAQWLRRTRPCGPDVATEVAAEVERLVADHPRDVLNALVANGARRPAPVADVEATPTDPTPAGTP